MSGVAAPASTRFICIEGGDGSGKTTLGRRLAQDLQRRGRSAVFLDKRGADLGEGFLGERLSHLRTILWDYPEQAPIREWGDHHWFHLLVSWFSLWDRVRVQPLLQEGRTVITDGWIYKYVARFGLKHEFPRHHIRRCLDHLTAPGTVLLLDVDPSVAAVRRRSYKATESGGLDGFRGRSADDFIAYQNRVRDELRRMAARSNWIVLDGERSEEALMADALRIVDGNRSS